MGSDLYMESERIRPASEALREVLKDLKKISTDGRHPSDVLEDAIAIIKDELQYVENLGFINRKRR